MAVRSKFFILSIVGQKKNYDASFIFFAKEHQAPKKFGKLDLVIFCQKGHFKKTNSSTCIKTFFLRWYLLTT